MNMRPHHLRKSRSILSAGVLAILLILAACGGGEGATTTADAGTDTTSADTEPAETTTQDTTESTAAEGPVGEGQTVTIGWIPWEEDIAVTNLWHAILEENGFTVQQQQLDAGLLFEGLATGDLDLFFDAWLPNTHADYWERNSDQIADLGIWLDEAPLTWTVPTYLEDINSIADLQGNGDLFGGQVVGIEPSAGLTRISRDEVIPTYGLEGEYELVESSTPAMLAELENAINNEEPIVVTLWRPHPAYAQYDLKDLEDPENALGDPDEIHVVARQDFADEFPEVAAAMENFHFDQATLSELEVAVLEDVPEGEELQGAMNWLAENTDYVNAWLEGTGLSVGSGS
jgi:glycine betaine/proline transport system substrate-binding protein